MKTMNIEQLIKYLYEQYGLKRTRRTISEYIMTGKIPHYKFNKKEVIFEQSEIDEWVKNNMIKGGVDGRNDKS